MSSIALESPRPWLISSSMAYGISCCSTTATNPICSGHHTYRPATVVRISCHLDWHQIVINDGSLTTDAALTITSLFVAFIAFCVPLTRLRSILDLTLSQWLKIYGKLSQFASVANFESSKSQFMLNSDRQKVIFCKIPIVKKSVFAKF